MNMYYTLYNYYTNLMNIYYHKYVFVDVFLPLTPIVLIMIATFSVSQF